MRIALLALIQSLCFVGMGFSVLMLIRNKKVSEFRRWMLDTIHEHSVTDIRAGHNYDWRYKAYESVDYDTMVYKFWRPLKPESFYEDTSFLEASKDA
jgi:hypothetical protein